MLLTYLSDRFRWLYLCGFTSGSSNSIILVHMSFFFILRLYHLRSDIVVSLALFFMIRVAVDICPFCGFHTSFKILGEGGWDCLMGEGNYGQAWWPELHSQDSGGGMRELTLRLPSGICTYTVVCIHTYTQKLIHAVMLTSNDVYEFFENFIHALVIFPSLPLTLPRSIP